jgi:Xaa-Pro aminopeptidase
MSANPRTCNAVSAAEMRRRWAAVRTPMRAQDVDALVLQNSSDWVGGHIRWFSNQPATNGYPTSAVFPLEGGISLIEQGPFGLVRETPGASDGIARRLTTPSYPSVACTAAYDAELALAELRRLGVRRVGSVAPAGWYHGFGAALRTGLALAGVELVDLTDEVDAIKAIKSEEERQHIRAVAAMQDEVMARVAAFVRPGMRDFEIAAYAQYQGQLLGSEQGIFLCSSAAPGQAASFRPRSLQGRTLQAGDVYSLLVENNGAGGFYAELSRIFVLGRASTELRDTHARVLEAQRAALAMLVPGTLCKDIHARHNTWLRDHGMAEERRLSIHGMGHDMVERPLVRGDETMAIEQHMAIVVHPGVLNERLFVHNTDLYLIEANGPGECLHRTPKEIFEIT